MNKVLFAGVAALLIAGPAEAAYKIDVRQVGNDVVATGSGSILTTGLTSDGHGGGGDGRVESDAGIIGVGDRHDFNSYTGITGPGSFGGMSTPYLFASSTSGEGVLMNNDGDRKFYLGQDYVSGTDLGTSTATFRNQSLQSLQLVVGSYVYTFGSGNTADTFTVDILQPAPGAVPEPATWAMMLVGFGAVGFAMRRRQSLAIALA